MIFFWSSWTGVWLSNYYYLVKMNFMKNQHNFHIA